MKLKDRKSLRLTGYDYSKVGYYFVTICVYGRTCLFGNIVDSKMILNDPGNMIYSALQTMPNQYSNIKLDEFIVMPDHIHAIIEISHDANKMRKSLPEIIRELKMYTTSCYIRGVRENGYIPFVKCLWQRGYYEHIIRNANSLMKIRQYIIDNPINWKLSL